MLESLLPFLTFGFHSTSTHWQLNNLKCVCSKESYRSDSSQHKEFKIVLSQWKINNKFHMKMWTSLVINPLLISIKKNVRSLIQTNKTTPCSTFSTEMVQKYILNNFLRACRNNSFVSRSLFLILHVPPIFHLFG